MENSASAHFGTTGQTPLDHDEVTADVVLSFHLVD
jgi:hypothetical protein